MPRLTRRTFCAAIAFAGLPLRGIAQATPEPRDIKAIVGYEDGAQRTFAIADPGIGDILGGSLVSINAAVMSFATEAKAALSIPLLATWYQDRLESIVSTDPDFESATVRVADVSMDKIGDDRLARSIVVERGGSDAWSYAICIVQGGDWVQSIVGQSARGAMAPTLELAESLIDRWPSDDLEDALPTIDDVPPGMTEVDS